MRAPDRLQTQGQRWSRQAGGFAVEVVLLAPVLLVLLAFVVTVGRIGEIRGAVVHAAQQAARAGSLRGTAGVAGADVTAVAHDNLRDQHVPCRDLDVGVDTLAFGRGGEVAVTVGCVVDLADVVFAGMPGSRTVTAHATEVIDVYRGGP